MWNQTPLVVAARANKRPTNNGEQPCKGSGFPQLSEQREPRTNDSKPQTMAEEEEGNPEESSKKVARPPRDKRRS